MAPLSRSILLAFACLALLCFSSKAVSDEDGFNDEGGTEGSDVDTYGDSGSDDPYGYGGESGGYGGEDGYGPSGHQPPKLTAKELESVDEINDFIGSSAGESFVIGYFDLTSNSDDHDIFTELAESDGHRLKFGVCTKKEVLEDLKYDMAVFVYRPLFTLNEKYEKRKSRYPAKKLKKESLQKFVYDKALPLVGEKTYKSSDLYERSKVPVVTVFTAVDTAKNPKGFKYITNRVVKVAKDYVGKFVFNVADKDDWNYVLDDYGIEPLKSRSDIAVGLQTSTMSYKMSDSFSPEKLKKFLEDFSNGLLTGKEKVIRSSAAADNGEKEEDDPTSAVVTLTDMNFEAEVIKTDKDVMLEFYAPWCGHCKALKPEYKSLAKTFQGNPSVTIAAMDATAQTVPVGFTVEGYPTVLYYPASTKTPISYDGERNADAMEEFIREQLSKRAKKN